MGGDQSEQEQEAETKMEDRALHPRDPQDRKDRRLRWAQTIASGVDAAARLADIAIRVIR